MVEASSMIHHSNKFKAKFSATAYMWTVWLDDIEFEVRHLVGIEGLKTEIQEVVANEVDLEWQGDILKLLKWETILTVRGETLYDPDKPRNLAKTVTVK